MCFTLQGHEMCALLIDRSELFKTFNVAHISPHENTVNLPGGLCCILSLEM